MSAIDSGPRASRTVLVIEPDPDVRRLLKTVLDQSGFTVLEGVGVHAVGFCRAVGTRVDVVLSEDPVAANGIPVVTLRKPFALPQLVASLDAAIDSEP